MYYYCTIYYLYSNTVLFNQSHRGNWRVMPLPPLDVPIHLLIYLLLSSVVTTLAFQAGRLRFNPGLCRTSTQGLKIIEEKVLPLH